MRTDDQPSPEAVKTWLGGCFLSHISKPDLLNLVADWIGAGEKGHYVAAINVSKLVAMQSDEKLAGFLRSSSVNIADGAPIYAATRLVGKPIPERITGVGLMEDLMELADENQYRVFFLGSKQDVLEKVIDQCERAHPGLVVAGARNGYFGKEQEPSIVAEIAASNADILFVALGIPQKEYFVDDHIEELNVSLALPVGGAFDVFAGSKIRAPRWVQRLGVEWLWRSVYDRSRAGLIRSSFLPFMKIVLREILSQRFSKREKM